MIVVTSNSSLKSHLLKKIVGLTFIFILSHNDISTTLVIEKLKQIYNCDCSKDYKYKQGLSRHKKECTYKLLDRDNEIRHDIKI